MSDEVEGACPYFHLASIVLCFGQENRISCLACGARGVLGVDSRDGVIRSGWGVDCGVPSGTWRGEGSYCEDIQRVGWEEGREIKGFEGGEGERKWWRGVKIERVEKVELPSLRGVS